MPRRRLLAPADERLHLLPRPLQADPQRFQHLGRHALAFMDQAQQEVLSADVIVVQHPGFFLRQHHNPACPVGKPLEHAPRRPSHPHPAMPAAIYDRWHWQSSAELRAEKVQSQDDEIGLATASMRVEVLVSAMTLPGCPPSDAGPAGNLPSATCHGETWTTQTRLRQRSPWPSVSVTSPKWNACWPITPAWLLRTSGAGTTGPRHPCTWSLTGPATSQIGRSSSQIG